MGGTWRRGSSALHKEEDLQRLTLIFFFFYLWMYRRRRLSRGCHTPPPLAPFLRLITGLRWEYFDLICLPGSSWQPGEITVFSGVALRLQKAFWPLGQSMAGLPCFLPTTWCFVFLLLQWAPPQAGKKWHFRCSVTQTVWQLGKVKVITISCHCNHWTCDRFFYVKTWASVMIHSLRWQAATVCLPSPPPIKLFCHVWFHTAAFSWKVQKVQMPKRAITTKPFFG